MDSIKVLKSKNVKMIAHRGLSGIERENTINSFIAAGNKSYFGIECDVHVTSNGKYLIYHDDNTGRLCNEDLIIEKTDDITLRNLKMKDPNEETWSDILKMPTLVEYLQIVSRYEKMAIIELKNHMLEKNIKEIIDICEKNYSLDKIVFISFDYENLITVRKLLPQQKLFYLTDYYNDQLIEKLRKYQLNLDIYYELLTEQIVKKLHENDIEINCWTVDEIKKAEELIQWGVDNITTNILE